MVSPSPGRSRMCTPWRLRSRLDIRRLADRTGRAAVRATIAAAGHRPGAGGLPDRGPARAARRRGGRERISRSIARGATDHDERAKLAEHSGLTVSWGRYEIRATLGEVAGSRRPGGPGTRCQADRVIKQFHDASPPDAKREFAWRTASRTTCARVYDIIGRPATWSLSTSPGTNLKSSLRKARDVACYRAIALDVLSALSHLHARLVHRDITPGNVIVTPEGRAKLIDFGMAGRPRAAT